MTRIEGGIVIGRPIDEVFDVVADARSEPRYNPRMVRVELLSDEPVGLGARFRAQLRSSRGRVVPMTIEWVAVERPRRLGAVTRSAAFEASGELRLEFVEDGTLLRWSWDVRPQGAMRRLAPVAGVLGGWRERRLRVSLKRLLEAGGGAPGRT